MAVGVRINNWVSLEFLGVQDGQVVETVFTYISSTMAITEGDLLAFVTSWKTIMTPIMQNCLSSQFVFWKVRATTHFKDFPNVQAEQLFAPGTTGGIAGVMAPGSVTLAVKLLTGQIGRRNRGRQYWPGFADAMASGGTASSTAVTTISAVFARHLTGFTASGVTYLPGVASRTAQYIRNVVGFVLDNMIDCQRRRLIGRGQ